MQSAPRTKFNTLQLWNNFISNLLAPGSSIDGQLLSNLRQAVYAEIEAIRGRPLIVYAAKFQAQPGAPIAIDVTDVDAFTDLVSSFGPEIQEIDVLIHSPGGDPAATERIVNILRTRFVKVHFLIPHSAYSAATMLALSGNTIVLHPSGTLGPIDPQINGVPARAIRRGFDKVKDTIKNEGPEALPAYIPLIEKHSLELLEICEDSEKLSKELVTDWLLKYMFNGDTNKEEQIGEAVLYFSDYDTHLIHSRPLSIDKLRQFNLQLSLADGELKDLLWEAYIMVNGLLSITTMVKLFENTRGVSWARNFMVATPAPQQTNLQIG